MNVPVVAGSVRPSPIFLAIVAITAGGGVVAWMAADSIEPLALDSHGAALRLLQRIRDEAHRFAITFHRQSRHKRDLQSELDLVPGIGLRRRKTLLTAFGSVNTNTNAFKGNQESLPLTIFSMIRQPSDHQQDRDHDGLPRHRMYGELASWWPLISPPEEYAEEAAFAASLLRSANSPTRTVLELGSGGGSISQAIFPFVFGPGAVGLRRNEAKAGSGSSETSQSLSTLLKAWPRMMPWTVTSSCRILQP